MTVSSENKLIARHALNAFGGSPNVQTYHRDAGELNVDVLRCVDRPYKGVSSCSTIGLSDHPMLDDSGVDFPVRIELVGACSTASDLFPNILATAAFCIIRARRVFRPGSVLENYVREYYPLTTVPHLFLTAPFLWEETLKTVDCGAKKVSWLLVVPISEVEREYLSIQGDEALEDLFEKHQIDIFDLKRDSVV